MGGGGKGIGKGGEGGETESGWKEWRGSEVKIQQLISLVVYRRRGPLTW